MRHSSYLRLVIGTGKGLAELFVKERHIIYSLLVGQGFVLSNCDYHVVVSKTIKDGHRVRLLILIDRVLTSYDRYKTNGAVIRAF
jgi:hypothetical protein